MPAQLRELSLPAFGLPTVEPVVPPQVYEARLYAARQRAFQIGLDALIVYGDREHFANLAYLTGYDPRFEEALLIIVPQRPPTLLIGNEGMAYSALVPYAIDRVLYQPFSLLGQPRDQVRPLKDILSEARIGPGMRIGTVGWKYYDPRETEYPDRWIELPAFIVDTLRAMGTEIRNATALFMHSSTGLRALNELEQLARFEFVSTYSSQAVRDLIFSIRPGLTELEAARLMGLNGLELSAHIVMLSGERTRLGLASASQRVIERGDPVFANLALWGANTARGGFLVEAADELPDAIRDYVERLVAPYFDAVAAWYETLAIGVSGASLHDAIHSRIGDPFFGVTLNPGHLIHLDEWLNSPVYAGSAERIRSGMALQVDVIPATGTEYFTTNIEDTVLIADDRLRAAFAERYPEAWGRIMARRDFIQDVLGIALSPEILPCSNLPAYLPPFWLAPRMALTRRA